MSSDDSTSSSVPSAANTIDDDSTTGVEEFPMQEDIVDKSMEPDAEEKALKLKDEGNQQLVQGHFLQAIGFYSEALEYAPTNAIILSNRAHVYIKVENYGLAISDATTALASDPTYAKAYYRRGSAHFALTHYKEARKDFRKVCQMKPKDKDARAKLQACEKAIKEEAFKRAIMSEKTVPLSETYDPSSIYLVPDNYDGPHPLPEGLTDSMEMEAKMFEPGNLPRAFVVVRYDILGVTLANMSIHPKSDHFDFYRFVVLILQLGCYGPFQKPKAHSQALCCSLATLLQEVF